MPLKILITGGAGFIGSHLADKLIQQGHQVKILDNFLTGKKENINQNAEFIQEDIRNLEKIKPHFKAIDYVFHTAALPRVQESIENPLETNEINITGTLNVLIAARDAKVKKVIYSASSAAYGDSEILPLTEDMKPSPKNPYGLQKYVGEEYCKLFSMFYNLKTVNLRYFNVYGKRMSDRGAYVSVMSIFLRQRKNKEPLTITGDGTQTRDFTHVEDVVRANILAMQSDKVGKGETINIGAGKNYSINQIADLFKSAEGIKHTEPRVEVHDTLADNSKAKELLSWQPEKNLEEAIGELIEF
jgi:UDP-glucose 4-epimerase